MFRINHFCLGVQNLSAKVLGILKDSAVVQEAAKEDRCILVTDRTNFYAEAGGQLSDIGRIHNKVNANLFQFYSYIKYLKKK